MNTSQSQIHNQDAGKSPERLEEEVNQTRARIGERLDTLSNRLSPGELLDQALGMAREHGGEFTRNLGAQIKGNPVPFIITGIGMSWLMLASNDHNHQRGARHSYDHLKDSAREKTDRASEIVQHNLDGMHQHMHLAGQNMRSAQECVTDFLQEQPVLAASLGVALGAAIGALLPATEMEDKLMGDASGQAVHKAQDLATGQYEKLRETAKEVVENVKQSSSHTDAQSARDARSSEGAGSQAI